MGVPEEDRTDEIVRVRGIGVVVGVGGGSGRTSAADHRINIVSGGDLAGWYVAYNWLRSLLLFLPPAELALYVLEWIDSFGRDGIGWGLCSVRLCAAWGWPLGETAGRLCYCAHRNPEPDVFVAKLHYISCGLPDGRNVWSAQASWMSFPVKRGG